MKSRLKMEQLNNYALYYGTGKEAELANFDLAIVEPLGQTRSSIQFMHEKETLVIAYISVIEIHPTNLLFGLLKDEDFLSMNGQRLMNKEYGTYLLDLHSTRWIGLMNHHIGKLLMNELYDGIFLDTIGNVGMHQIPQSIQFSQEEAAISWVKQIRNIFPETIIIQNNGLESLCLNVATWIDAICWENPPLEDHSSKEWNEVIITRLAQLKKEFGIQTLLLLEQINDEESNKRRLAREVASTYDFLVYFAPYQYVSNVNIENVQT
jgi:hypothetical protein